MLPGLIVANDMVGVGKVAASISLPLLASCQIETRFLPTVVLSTHTGGFQDIVKVNFENEISQFLKQWQELSLTHEAILTGYCPSPAAYESILNFSQTNHIPLAFDPIMADNGKLYAGFTDEHVKVLRKVCQSADIIFPNLTEAGLLTGENVFSQSYQKDDILSLAKKLAQLGPEHIVLTGVTFDEKIGVAYYNSETESISYHLRPVHPGHFFGTGDILSAIVTAGYCYKLDLEIVIHLALDFIDWCIESTITSKRDPKFGLVFEPHLTSLQQSFIRLIGEDYEK